MAKIPPRPNYPCTINSSSRKIGAYYEATARTYLEQAGLIFIAANVILYRGELDLIMREQETLVFVEVRYRHSAKFGPAVATINQAKRNKLITTAAHWLATKGKSLDNTLCRFDVFAITGQQILWLPNAFDINYD